ncbi:MAG: peptide deformylase [Alistipes sp.]|nr:peptide deformylase [Alistipes sp.]
MKLILAIIMTISLSTTSCQRGFTEAEKATIGTGNNMMPVMSIDNEKDSLLIRKKSKPLTKKDVLSEEFATLCRRMLKTVRNPENEGVGIAAPQVGILRRLVAVQRFDKEGEPFEFYVNPEIVEYGEPKEYGNEGCLSVPNHRGEVLRSRCITLRYRDLQFKRQTEIIEDFTAVIFQHEIDHLDGILYIDRISDTPNGEVAEETTKQ